MSKEAGWIATMLTVLLIVMAFLSPVRTGGQLPTLEEMERPSTMSRIPLVGPIIACVQQQMILVTWRLESIPIE